MTKLWNFCCIYLALLLFTGTGTSSEDFIDASSNSIWVPWKSFEPDSCDDGTTSDDNEYIGLNPFEAENDLATSNSIWVPWKSFEPENSEDGTTSEDNKYVGLNPFEALNDFGSPNTVHQDLSNSGHPSAPSEGQSVSKWVPFESHNILGGLPHKMPSIFNWVPFEAQGAPEWVPFAPKSALEWVPFDSENAYDTTDERSMSLPLEDQGDWTPDQSQGQNRQIHKSLHHKLTRNYWTRFRESL